MIDDKKSLLEHLEQIQELYKESADLYAKEADDFWNNLSYDDKLLAFYSVCKRIHEGDVKLGGSYRYVLYDVFDFEADAYGAGMECGYMDIHNLIIEGKEKGQCQEDSPSDS